jgi:hypothetical protein
VVTGAGIKTDCGESDRGHEMGLNIMLSWKDCNSCLYSGLSVEEELKKN